MKNLTLIYIAALTIIALVIGISQYLVQRSISTSFYDSHTINISGRQSMLSQKITKAALAMETAESEKEFEASKEALIEATDLWEKSHHALQYGNESMELDNVNNSEQTLLFFLELEPHYISIREAVSRLILIDFYSEDKREDLKKQVDIILQHEDNFLDMMNAITLDYDKESRARVNELSRTEYILLGVAMILLLLEGLFIFRPVINQIIVSTKKLLRQEESLKRALKKQKQERAKVDFLVKQAESVFSNVKQGIFLLDKRLAISELYSSAMDEIFENENLGGTNFLELMRTRLLKRDHDALEMFVTHLFNGDIQEYVLSRLNPVQEVELFYSRKNAEIESRHISISFSRIKSKQQILSVLVTVTDKTEEVRMQQQLAENEERNKKESAQLLSILKVNPNTLKEFLSEAKTALDGISHRYEIDKDSNLVQLMSFTYQTIHKLKGNATLVDVDILADKLHATENIIVKLKQNPDLASSDFLNVLYEINELSQIVVNMQQMLVRLAEVNQQLAQENSAPQNQNLVATLKSGLTKMSKELDKQAQLIFEDNGLIIPEQHRQHFKDIVVQLFRNSLVHGIESQEERIELGKSSTGQIKIEIKQEGDQFMIIYEDDGRGLDKKKILEKAIKAGRISPVDASSIDNESIMKLIFSDDFSTADTVTNYAGRGQGLGLIKSIIYNNNGKFRLGSKRGRTFRMTISLPLESKLTQVA